MTIKFTTVIKGSSIVSGVTVCAFSKDRKKINVAKPLILSEVQSNESHYSDEDEGWFFPCWDIELPEDISLKTLSEEISVALERLLSLGFDLAWVVDIKSAFDFPPNLLKDASPLFAIASRTEKVIMLDNDSSVPQETIDRITEKVLRSD